MNGDERAVLARVPFLAELADDVLDRLVAMLETEKHPAGAMPVRTGEPGRGLFIVASGRLRAIGSGVEGSVYLQDHLGPGDSFEELAILDAAPSPLTLEAEQPCELLLLSHESFQALLRRSPELVPVVLAGLASTMRSQSGAGSVDISSDVAGRVADALARIIANDGGTDGSVILLRREAVRTALSVTLGRHGPAPDNVLLVLESTGCIEIVGDGVRVRDAALLDSEVRALSISSLIRRAFHDPLTGLVNRTQFDLRIGGATAAALRLALLMIDLDHFKPINDNFGHQAGDEVLRHVAERLLRCIRRSDTVARLGGDEFAVLLVDPGDGDDVAVAQRMIDSLAQPMALTAGQTVTVGTSIGVTSTKPGQRVIPADLVRQADAALYRAKESGRGQLVIDPMPD